MLTLGVVFKNDARTFSLAVLLSYAPSFYSRVLPIERLLETYDSGLCKITLGVSIIWVVGLYLFLCYYFDEFQLGYIITE